MLFGLPGYILLTPNSTTTEGRRAAAAKEEQEQLQQQQEQLQQQQKQREEKEEAVVGTVAPHEKDFGHCGSPVKIFWSMGASPPGPDRQRYVLLQKLPPIG